MMTEGAVDESWITRADSNGPPFTPQGNTGLPQGSAASITPIGRRGRQPQRVKNVTPPVISVSAHAHRVAKRLVSHAKKKKKKKKKKKTREVYSSMIFGFHIPPFRVGVRWCVGDWGPSVGRPRRDGAPALRGRDECDFSVPAHLRV